MWQLWSCIIKYCKINIYLTNKIRVWTSNLQLLNKLTHVKPFFFIFIMFPAPSQAFPGEMFWFRSWTCCQKMCTGKENFSGNKHVHMVERYYSRQTGSYINWLCFSIQIGALKYFDGSTSGPWASIWWPLVLI